MWIAAAVVFAIDRVTKAWAVQELALVHTRPLLGEWVRLTYVRNTGVAFGLGAGQGLPFAAITFAALLLVVLVAAQPRNRTWARSLALGLVVGGAAGNLLDRVRWGSVVDFIDFGYRRNVFPVFNAADSAITIGVALFALTLLFGRDAPTEARITENLVIEGKLDFWFGCDCCAVGQLRPAGPDDPPDILRGREVQLIWDVDALFAWTLDEFEDYLASERYALPTTPRVAATEDLGLPVVDIPSEALRKGNEWFGTQGGGLYAPLDLKYLELT